MTRRNRCNRQKDRAISIKQNQKQQQIEGLVTQMNSLELKNASLRKLLYDQERIINEQSEKINQLESEQKLAKNNVNYDCKPQMPFQPIFGEENTIPKNDSLPNELMFDESSIHSDGSEDIQDDNSDLEGIGFNTQEIKKKKKKNNDELDLKNSKGTETNQIKECVDYISSNNINGDNLVIVDLENNCIIELKSSECIDVKAHQTLQNKCSINEYCLKNKTRKCSEFKSTTEGSCNDDNNLKFKTTSSIMENYLLGRSNSVESISSLSFKRTQQLSNKDSTKCNLEIKSNYKKNPRKMEYQFLVCLYSDH